MREGGEATNGGELGRGRGEDGEEDDGREKRTGRRLSGEVGRKRRLMEGCWGAGKEGGCD